MDDSAASCPPDAMHNIYRDLPRIVARARESRRCQVSKGDERRRCRQGASQSLQVAAGSASHRVAGWFGWRSAGVRKVHNCKKLMDEGWMIGPGVSPAASGGGQGVRAARWWPSATLICALEWEHAEADRLARGRRAARRWLRAGKAAKHVPPGYIRERHTNTVRTGVGSWVR